MLPTHHEVKVSTVDLLKTWREGDINHRQDHKPGDFQRIFILRSKKQGCFEPHGASLIDSLKGLEEALDDAGVGTKFGAGDGI